jgi:hypothetical protein
MAYDMVRMASGAQPEPLKQCQVVILGQEGLTRHNLEIGELLKKLRAKLPKRRKRGQYGRPIHS